ncbi:MAG: hypothetical protein ACRD3W_02875, partial [Terriglobales bacterium]
MNSMVARKTLSICIVLSAALCPAALAKKKQPEINFFGGPDTQTGQPPAFTGAKPQPPVDAGAMIGATGEMPRYDLIRGLPSLTGDQRKQLNSIFDLSRKEAQPLSRKISTLQKLIRDKKGNAGASKTGNGQTPTAGDLARQDLHLKAIASGRGTRGGDPRGTQPVLVAQASEPRATEPGPVAHVQAEGSRTSDTRVIATPGTKPAAQNDDDETTLANEFANPEEMQAEVDTLKEQLKGRAIDLSKK